MQSSNVAVIILTLNERAHIERAVKSVSRFARTIHIIDSGSIDGTLEIGRMLGAEVLLHEWKNYADQFRWALENITTDAGWIMRLDADEIIAPDLAARLSAELPRLPPDIVGINIDRQHIFMGRWIRHGGRYPLRLLRIFRKGHGRIEQRWMDEHIVVEGGRTVHFTGGFADHNLNDLTYFTEKHNKYATREAIDILDQRRKLFVRDQGVTADATSQQVAVKRFFKEHLYNKLPFTVSVPLYFLYRYIIQLGFLDGKEGLIYHFLQGCWYRFLVGAKVMELEQAVSHLRDNSEVRKELARLTGLSLGD